MGFETRLLYLANFLAQKVRIGKSYDHLADSEEPGKIAQNVGLDDDTLDLCTQKLDGQRSEIKQFFEIIF